MTRMLLFVFAIGALSACAQYRELQANCFSFVSRTPASMDCDFEPLDGPETTGGLDE